jgi:hypothetical protein
MSSRCNAKRCAEQLSSMRCWHALPIIAHHSASTIGLAHQAALVRCAVWCGLLSESTLVCIALPCSALLSSSLSLFASGRSTVCTHTHHTICGDQSQTLAVAAQLRCLQLLATLFDAKVLPDLSLSECARFGCCMAAAVARSTINAANQVQ